ncbi:hypothetical protein D3C78_1100320 [compost metagenome]
MLPVLAILPELLADLTLTGAIFTQALRQLLEFKLQCRHIRLQSFRTLRQMVVQQLICLTHQRCRLLNLVFQRLL